jgi:hypothetical protein
MAAMKRRVAAALFCATILAGCATRPEGPVAPTQAEWDAISAADYTCAPSEFTDVAFDAVAASPDRYYEKCIRLRALLSGVALLRDASSLKTPNAFALGIYPRDDKTLANPRPQFAIVEGRLRSCGERLRRLTELDQRTQATAPKPGPGPIQIHLPPMLGGFCHTGGAAVWANDVTVLPTAMD